MKPMLASAPDPIPLSEWDPYLDPRPEPRAAPVAPAAPSIPEPVAERLTELEAFCLRAGRRPVHGALDPQEASLAGWVHLIRRRRAWRPYIDAVVHPYPVRNPQKLEQLRAYCLRHGHRPAKRSADPEVAGLARWASEAQYQVDPDPELLALLKRYPPRPTPKDQTT